MPDSLLQLSSASGAAATETLCALIRHSVECSQQIIQDGFLCMPIRRRPVACSQTQRSKPRRAVAQKKLSPLEVSQSRASIRRSLHHTRTMANRGPMGRTPPAALALKTIRLQRLGREHSTSMSTVRPDSCLHRLLGIVERSWRHHVIPQPSGAEVAGQHAHCVSRVPRA